MHSLQPKNGSNRTYTTIWEQLVTSCSIWLMVLSPFMVSQVVAKTKSTTGLLPEANRHIHRPNSCHRGPETWCTSSHPRITQAEHDYERNTVEIRANPATIRETKDYIFESDDQTMSAVSPSDYIFDITATVTAQKVNLDVLCQNVDDLVPYQVCLRII